MYSVTAPNFYRTQDDDSLLPTQVQSDREEDESNTKVEEVFSRKRERHPALSAPMERGGSDLDTIDDNIFQKNYTVSHFSFDELHQTPALNRGAGVELTFNRMKAAWDHGLNPATLPPCDTARYTEPFHLIFSESTNQGPRPNNEDCHVHFKTDREYVFAVCDGHGVPKRKKAAYEQDGYIAAKIAEDSTKTNLVSELDACFLDPKEAFARWAETTHQMIPQNLVGGVAYVGAIVEVVNARLIVNSVGDGKIVVFRKHNGKYCAIPMSPIRNWKTEECLARARKIMTAEEYEGLVKTGRIMGLAVSNCLGDHQVQIRGKTPLSHTPIPSHIQLKPGDIIVSGCDGLWDYVTFAEAENLVEKHCDAPNLADILAKFALNEKESKDNVTVMVATMVPGKAPPELERLATEPINWDELE
jgi:serine/threonine protein phosphatase PrpC